MYKSKRIIAILSALVLTFNNILITSVSAVSSEEIVVTTVPDSSEVTDITTVVPDMTDSDNNTSISSSDAVTSNSESISYIIDGTRKEYTSTDIKDINEFTQVAETVDPNTTSVEIAPGIPLEGVELEEFKTQTAPQYPKDWKTWKRSNPLWSDIKIGNSTVGIVGSPLIAIAKLLVQNNAIPNQGFNPADYCEWVSSNNIIGEDNRIND